MSEMFKPVEVTKSFLGIKKGTILKFDMYSSKYISVVESEDIGDGYEYYSGSAVELDPFVIERNLGKFFDIIELNEAEKPEPIEEPVAETPVKENEELVNAGQSEAEPQPEPEDKPIGGDLIFDCGLCRHKNFVAHMTYGLLLPAAAETSLTFKCANCNIETRLYYNMSDGAAQESK